ncbi:tRNA/rRNA methyltransferase [Orbus wheelerorum]|uniref:tRNA/rRNA methyltransferase n=1 Tax=Orbus wheelerorum TaxID=3074111 RepID=UPI00370D7B6A
MSDNASSDNKAKPTIFYAQKSQEEKPKRTYGKRDTDKPRSNDRGNYGKFSSDKPRSDRTRTDSRRVDDGRAETSGRSSYGKPSSDKPRSDRPRTDSRRADDSRVETFSRSSYGKPASDSDRPRTDSRRAGDSRGETFSRSSYGKPASDKPRSDRPRTDSRRADDSRVETFSRSSYGKPASDKPRSDRPRTDSRRADDSRVETFSRSSYGKPSSDRPRSDRPRYQNEEVEEGGSPWKNRFQSTEQLPTFDTESKSTVDNEQIKRQRKEETFVYSENSCKAVFDNRPDMIVKAFLLQEKTYEFKALIAYLVEHRLGYDVITDEQMTKIAQTPHHGGICLIVKKRQPQLTLDYLSKSAQLEQDCVLAIDDINNPHNLGGIVRTAAFFGVNGLLLRQLDLLENGAALRVSEGGAETITPIKADDLSVSIDQFKQQGYQIVALLPCKVNSIKAETFAKAKLNAKVVFIVFQQINTHLANLADKIIYLPGSESMSALNISVLTGIMLAKWQEKTSKI